MTHVRCLMGGALILAAVVVAAGCGKSQSEVKLDTDEQRMQYALGYTIGQQIDQNFESGFIEIDPEIFTAGVRDVFTDSPKLTQESIDALLDQFSQNQQARMQEMLEQSLAEASVFLAENAANAGVVTLEDSVQYRVITEGTGAMPGPEDVVVVNYRGTLLDGTEFDNSYTRGEPVQFPLNQVIPGWSTALQQMRTGAEYEVWIPPQLAYGEMGAGNIPPNAVLKFEIELLDVNPDSSQAE